MTLDWLIVGGGIHGVHLATRLIGERGVAPDRLRIVDPAGHLLSRWRASTETVGMTYLRSSAVQHLDLDVNSLRSFAGHRKNRKPGLFAAPYNRPSLALFNAHCEVVMKRFALSDLHIKARVLTCSVSDDGVSADLSDGSHLSALRAVLALGASEQPRWPTWAPKGDPRVQHIFDSALEGWPSDVNETILVVGGGISAGQVALRLERAGHNVHLLSRHALREHQFDSDPGWLGPKFMARFDREPNTDRRRDMIQKARHRGSVPPDLKRRLRNLISRGRITWHEAEIADLAPRPDHLHAALSTGLTVDVDRVLLATGFVDARPGGAMVDKLIASAGLPCGRCGYPIVDRALRWHPRLHVCGPLAELELGPAARNIAGARRAGDRLVSDTVMS